MDGVVVDNRNSDFQAKVNYSCDTGYFFNALPAWRVTECSENGTWFLEIEKCNGKSTVSYSRNLNQY